MNLLQRVLTALLAGPLIIYLIWWHNPYGFYLLAVLALWVAAWEYGSIVLPKEQNLERVILLLGCTVVSALEFLRLDTEHTGRAGELPSSGVVLGLALVLLSIFYLLRMRDLEATPRWLALHFFGLVYCGVLITYVAATGLLGAGPAWVTMLLTISWFNDTGGYFAGRFLGGKIFSKKLYAEVSPKKTWEGFFGGLIGSVLATLLAQAWYFPLGYAAAGNAPGPNLSLLDCLLIGIPAGAIGVCGDLVESLFKRAYGVKDSGNILPGHGGILDRIDALLFAAPYVYLYGRYFFDQG